jgi:methylated-DNA-protein-cysteine methyltransferase-like protein
VATYGEIARLAGIEGQARLVGYALHALPPQNAVPWHRVINARGGISLPGDSHAYLLQRTLLEQEGVEFDAQGAVDLSRFGWP